MKSVHHMYEAPIQTVCCTHTVKHGGWYDKKYKKYTPQCKVRKLQAMCLILHKKCCMYRHRRWQCAGKSVYDIFNICTGQIESYTHAKAHTPTNTHAQYIAKNIISWKDIDVVHEIRFGLLFLYVFLCIFSSSLFTWIVIVKYTQQKCLVRTLQSK